MNGDLLVSVSDISGLGGDGGRRLRSRQGSFDGWGGHWGGYRGGLGRQGAGHHVHVLGHLAKAAVVFFTRLADAGEVDKGFPQ